MAEELVKFYNIQPEKIKVICGGIDAEDFKKISSKIEIDDLKSKYKINSNGSILIYAGRIVPQKGLIYLIKSLALLKNEVNFHLLIAGTAIDSSYYDSILEFIKANNLDNKIQFFGYVDQFDIFKLLNIASVVVLPSLYEPFGMANIQAAVLDKAIIATNAVGSNEILNKYSKIIVVKPASSNALAKGIKRAMSLRDVKDSSTFNDYSWEEVSNKILNLFQGSL